MAQSFIIATGSRNVDDPEIPYDGRRIINCDRLLQSLGWKIPQRPVIVGATRQGLEYASTLGIPQWRRATRRV
jgi:pyruvate/2-oxoglutarate dehydrogenase complex dihydrolipoamide dehydrogenase (E3) component